MELFRCKGGILSASKLCVRFGISEKAVLDIWTGRTWSRETARLDSERPACIKRTGRPLGCKDKVPRRKPGVTEESGISNLVAPPQLDANHQSHGTAQTVLTA